MLPRFVFVWPTNERERETAKREKGLWRCNRMLNSNSNLNSFGRNSWPGTYKMKRMKLWVWLTVRLNPDTILEDWMTIHGFSALGWWYVEPRNGLWDKRNLHQTKLITLWKKIAFVWWFLLRDKRLSPLPIKSFLFVIGGLKPTWNKIWLVQSLVSKFYYHNSSWAVTNDFLFLFLLEIVSWSWFGCCFIMMSRTMVSRDRERETVPRPNIRIIIKTLAVETRDLETRSTAAGVFVLNDSCGCPGLQECWKVAHRLANQTLNSHRESQNFQHSLCLVSSVGI